MKLKSILTALLFALCCMGATAQTTYTEALERFFTLRGNSILGSVDQIKSGLLLMTDLLVEQDIEGMPKGYTSQELVDEYAEKHLLHDMVTCLVPVFAEKMAIADINKLSDMYDTTEGRIASEHDALFTNNFEISEDMEILLEQAGTDIAAGKTPRSVKSNASKKRRKLFHRYYEESEMGKLFDAYIDSVVEDELEDESQDKVDAYRKYISESMETILLNMIENYYTDADLKFFIKLMSTPEYKRAAEVLTETIGDGEEIGMAVIMKYAEWLEAHE